MKDCGRDVRYVRELMNTQRQLKMEVGLRSAAGVVLCCVVLAQFGMTARGAEDPARFLLATDWYATFTHTMSESGSLDEYTDPDGDNCSANWHFLHNITVTCQLAVDPQTIGHPYFRQFNWKLNDSGSVTISDKFEVTCTDPDTGSSSYHSYTVNDMGIVPTNFSLLINTQDQTYSVVWVGVFPPITSEIRYDDSAFPGNIGVPWSPDALNTNSLPATGMMLQGQDSFPMRDRYPVITPAAIDFIAGDPKVGGTSPLGPSLFGGNLVLTWSLRPVVEELEVVVEPEGYAEWKPEGNLNQPDQRGNSIKVSARLQKKGGGVPVARAKEFDFELRNVSAEPGVCMNFPIEAPSTEPDLKFEAELNPPSDSGGDTVIVADDVVGVMSGEQGMLTAHTVVSSFDFGAYGEIRVTANVSGRDPIVGYLKGDAQKRANISLPKCQPGSHIADIWKEQWGVADLDDEEDDEEFPQGDGQEFDHVGDGYTLYEEYRGFSENRDHRRLIPLRKEVFIRNDISDGRVAGAILLFKAASLLGVYHELRADEISQFGLMNGNHGHAYSGHPQSGILLKLRQQKLGYSQAVGAAGALGNSTPGSKLFADIEPVGEAGGLDFTGAETTSIFTLASIGTVAHEIAHCCSVWHHGELDSGERRWVMRLRPDGSKELHELPKDTDTPVTLLTQICKPDGTRALLPFEFVENSIYPRWVAAPHGQHSGDTGCMMCYDVANAYRRDAPGKRYVAQWLPVAQERLCTSPDGTGVNQSPNSRHGAADHGRGNCKGQICVNDKYAHAEEHNR